MAATTSAVELIGNASARISHLRREKVCSHLNKTLQLLVQRDEIFKKAAPFFAEFAKMSKEHIDQVKAIQAVLPGRKPSSFRDGSPKSRGIITEEASVGEAETSGPTAKAEEDTEQVSRTGTTPQNKIKDPRDSHRAGNLIVDIDFTISANQNV